VEKTIREGIQIAGANNVTNLLRIPYFVIGQLHAAKLVIDRVFSHLANNNPLPLVIVFAGPSGHRLIEYSGTNGFY
jgi:ATP-dependent Clp protease ATP-binding subunit ClpB